MPKKVKHESFKYCFLKEASNNFNFNGISNEKKSWEDFLSSLEFINSSGLIEVNWGKSFEQKCIFNLKDVMFYKKIIIITNPLMLLKFPIKNILNKLH